MADLLLLRHLLRDRDLNGSFRGSEIRRRATTRGALLPPSFSIYDDVKRFALGHQRLVGVPDDESLRYVNSMVLELLPSAGVALLVVEASASLTAAQSDLPGVRDAPLHAMPCWNRVTAIQSGAEPKPTAGRQGVALSNGRANHVLAPMVGGGNVDVEWAVIGPRPWRLQHVRRPSEASR